MRALLAGLILLLPPAAAPARTLGGIEFTPCEIRVERVPGRVKAECARFDVPENRAAPEVRRIGVRLALVPSRSDRPLPDPIVFLAGGPGQSAIEAYPIVRGALDGLLDRRHVLLVEQRGTGESNPLRCPLPDWKTAMDLSLEAAREDARKCLARYEGKADTRFYATSDYIADLEQVRRALGIPALNLAGGSYGTRVALEYLRRHPDAIRSVFIDSIAPPELALGQDHARNLDEAIASMARRCAQDAACRERFGDIDAALRALRQQVRAHARPVTFRHPQTNAAVTVKFGEAALGVARIFSYSPRTAALIPLLLSEAAAGRPEPLLAQAERLFDSLGDELASGMELSVICAEDADLLREDPADGDRLMGDEIPAYFRARCEVWPHNTRPADFKQPVVSAKPVLLLSGEHDPVTPPRYGEQVLKTLSNARHLVAKGQGHTPMNVGCLPRLYQQFVDKLDPRGLDASCLEALGDTPFFLDFQGPSP